MVLAGDRAVQQPASTQPRTGAAAFGGDRCEADGLWLECMEERKQKVFDRKDRICYACKSGALFDLTKAFEPDINL